MKKIKASSIILLVVLMPLVPANFSQKGWPIWKIHVEYFLCSFDEVTSKGLLTFHKFN